MAKLYLSASTQENNIGVNDYGTEENNMHDLRNAVKSHLFNTYIVKNLTIYSNQSKSITLQEIVKHSNDSKSDLHLAFHTNAGVKNIRGCEVYYHGTNKEGREFATKLYNAISELTPTEDRGVRSDFELYKEGLYELKYTTAMAVLIEFVYHTNAEDVAWFKNNFDNIVKAVARVIAEYFGYKPKKNYSQILKEVSIYSKVWEKFIADNPDFNLKELIETLYYTTPG
jgi:N-acetylmuramoyl-L-alanine amidase